MNREVFLLLAIASVAWASAAVPGVPVALQALPKGPQDFSCTGKDGYFPDPYRQCKVFYRCLPDGSKWAFACPLDLEFSDVEKTCMPADQVTCPPVMTNLVQTVETASSDLNKVKNCGGPVSFDCTGKNGYFADTYRLCQVFYRCLPDGTKYQFNCRDGLLFSQQVLTCLPADQVQCTPFTRQC